MVDYDIIVWCVSICKSQRDVHGSLIVHVCLQTVRERLANSGLGFTVSYTELEENSSHSQTLSKMKRD